MTGRLGLRRQSAMSSPSRTCWVYRWLAIAQPRTWRVRMSSTAQTSLRSLETRSAAVAIPIHPAEPAHRVPVVRLVHCELMRPGVTLLLLLRTEKKRH